jgi:hypothetical protein
MPYLGDVVQPNSQMPPQGQRHGMGILVDHHIDETNPVSRHIWDVQCQEVLHAREGHGRSLGWNQAFFDVVHELHTAEARAIHDAYPRHDGHDYFWYCQQRGVEPFRTPAELSDIDGIDMDYQEVSSQETPDHAGQIRETYLTDAAVQSVTTSEDALPWRQWQPGDVLECVSQQGASNGNVVPGDIVTLRVIGSDGELGVNNAAGTELDECMWHNAFRFVRRPSGAVINPAAVDFTNPENWQVGDTIELVREYRGLNYEGGIGDQFTAAARPGTGGSVRTTSTTTGPWFPVEGMRFLHRPAAGISEQTLPEPTDCTNTSNWLPGDILELTDFQYTGRFAGGSDGQGLRTGTQVVFRGINPNTYSDCTILVNLPSGRECTAPFDRVALRWVSRPAASQAPARTLQVGDRVRVVNSTEQFNGTEGVIDDLASGGFGNRIRLDNGLVQRWSTPKLELVTNPVEDLSTVPATEWRMGDTVRRVAATEETAFLQIGEETTIKSDRISGANQIMTNASRGGWWIPIADLVLVRRAGTAAPSLPTGLPRGTEVGARVLVNMPGTSSHGKGASIASGGTIGNYRVYIDGQSSTTILSASQVAPMVQEPLPKPLPEAFNACWLSCEGLTNDEVQEFVRQIVSTTSIQDRTTRNNGHGTSATGLRAGQEGRRGGLHCTADYLHYYQNDNAMPEGLLSRDWNQVLNRLRQLRGNGRPLAGWTVGTMPAKNHGLAKLPQYFILENTTGKAVESSGTWLPENGFRGYLGTYSLFSGNQVLGTELRGAAEAFQAKHHAVWLKSKEDKVLLSTLFRTRKHMLTTQAAQQRFAIDVAASGPHLIVAFKAFMASIGYRQENDAKQSGPYILLNGGNLYANQPATWQYSEVKNNRNAVINLAEPAQTKEDKDGVNRQLPSGWEKLGERLANRGVALPVLDAEDLDRAPVAGDKVCLVFNDVREGYPETDADLRNHTCGQQYTVRSLIGGQCLISETGLRLHPDRLQVLEMPKGLQNGDQVMMETAYGEHLAAGQILTLMNGTLVDDRNTAFAVPADCYTAVTPELLTQNLLRRYGMTLPCVVQVTSSEFPDHVGHEVVLSTAWPLNNQELAFWTEDTEERDAWFTRDAFQVVVADATPEAPSAWKVLKGATRETTLVQVGETTIPLAQLEAALAA